MQKKHSPRKDPKETELHEKLKRGLDGWIRNLPSMPTGVEKTTSEDPKKEQIPRSSDPINLSDGEGRWNDDGGGGGRLSAD